MTFETLVFYFLASILLFAGLRVVTARHPVHAALFLVLAFFTGAGLWLLLEAEFLAIALVLVYIGAVMVLFLFVVMMLNLNIEKMRQGFWDNLPLAGFVGILMAIEMTLVLTVAGRTVGSAPVSHAGGYSNTKELGRLLYTDYVYPFELAAVILLVAIVAAIAITLRRRPGTKHQDPAWQVSVKREDRVRLVAMPAEKEGE
ncbi:MAG: NADH-quinone oxidoreductase subunit J [Methyloversatilis sp.]|uniref:NADH-quinone oxidoreductase subunit J n=1 Tax=Methyloversatilis sp. TaxID=2569862 RepID=UPI002732FF66|nr:NADH-quinone oxidoreductase subunit J [Methyloversatilis sp.]MDP2868276.1 NADH-quinone oxidoreductase subunit J [Methyloversatilis sp.]